MLRREFCPAERPSPVTFLSLRSKVMPPSFPPSVPLSSLGLDEDVLVLGVQHTFADELLSDGNGHVVGHAQI